jgi:hypothetical protein
MQMMWRCFQAFIVGLVMCSNIRWHWTPNPYLAGLIGGFAAYLATLGITALYEIHRRSQTIGG